MKGRIWCFLGVHDLQVVRQGSLLNEQSQHIGYYYHMRCSVCGTMKKRKLM